MQQKLHDATNAAEEIAEERRIPCDSINAPFQARAIMGELYEERRQEPRFAAAGKYRLQLLKSGEMEGRIIDLSLNGALLESTISTQASIGARMPISIEFVGHEPFRGDVVLVRSEANQLGVEFYDMDPKNFAALSELIESLRKSTRN
jgi:PilZ domain